MHWLLGSVATLAVATIYCLWHLQAELRFRRERALRERVAYMLWMVADQRP